MIKAFKEVRAYHIDEVIENVVASNTEKETSDDENLFSDIEDDNAVQVNPSETDLCQEGDQ
jgi:phage terminase Nu1 subunit (DNA packaging protein)